MPPEPTKFDSIDSAVTHYQNLVDGLNARIDWLGQMVTGHDPLPRNWTVRSALNESKYVSGKVDAYQQVIADLKASNLASAKAAE